MADYGARQEEAEWGWVRQVGWLNVGGCLTFARGPPFPEPAAGEAPAQLVAVLVGYVHEQGHGRVVRLFDHRGEHVDVADHPIL
jgi:hypothetical protein